MELRRKLLSNMFIRNMTADLFGRSAYSKTPGDFIPYFLYKIGHYQADFYLYFPKEPYAIRYYNEIFNKLYEYKGYDIINYLEFHFNTYPNKHDFLRFLRYEIADRLKRRLQKANQLKLQAASEWVAEKQQELQQAQQAKLKQEIEADVREILPTETPFSQKSIETIAKALSEKLTDRIDLIMASTEERMQTIAESYVTGRIELNNQSYKEKLIKLFKLLQRVKAPQHIAKAEQLFKSFSDVDIAAILRLHFEPYKSKQHNSIQKTDIKKADESILDKSPKVQKLEEALQQFFYG